MLDFLSFCKRKHIFNILFFGFVIVMLYVSIKDCDFSSIASSIGTLKIQYLALAILMMIFQIYLEGYSIKLLAKKYDIRIGHGKSFVYSSVDLYFSQITPFAIGGQAMLVYYMAKDNISVSKSTIISLLYSVLNKIALVIIGLIAFILLNDSLHLSDDWSFIALLILGIVTNVIIISFCILCMFARRPFYMVACKFIRALGRKGVIKEPEYKIVKLTRTLAEYKKARAFIKEHLFMIIRVLILCLIKRIITFSIVFFVYKSLSLNGVSFYRIILIQSVLALISDSFIIPGGMLAFESCYAVLYSQVFPADLTSISMLLTRLASYYLLMLFTGIVTLASKFSYKMKNKEALINGSS